jgi:hypothetical protein
MLVPPQAPYLQNSSLLLAADCSAFACASLHQDFIKGKVTLIGCPKLDDADYYVDKLAAIFESNNIKDITVVHMEVPCCFGLDQIVTEAHKRSGKDTPMNTVILGVNGELKTT